MGNNVINSVGFISGFGPLIRGAKFINGFSGNTSGTVDIYTVPAGRKAFISWVYGISSPIMSGTLNIKVSGTYYNLLGANAAFGNVARLFVGQVINAGESFSFITGANPGGNLWVRIMEMDISTPLYTGRNLSLTSGANTLMTVSSGKTAMVIDSSGGCYINSSGGQYRNLSGISAQCPSISRSQWRISWVWKSIFRKRCRSQQRRSDCICSSFYEFWRLDCSKHRCIDSYAMGLYNLL